MSYKVNNVTVIDNERNISSSGIVTVGAGSTRTIIDGHTGIASVGLGITMDGNPGNIRISGIMTAGGLSVPINVSSFIPANGATNVAVTTSITINFDGLAGLGNTGFIFMRTGSAGGPTFQTIGVDDVILRNFNTLTFEQSSTSGYSTDVVLVMQAGFLKQSNGDFVGINTTGGVSYSFSTKTLGLGDPYEGGVLICQSGGTRHIVAPDSTEVQRDWYNRNDAVTTANANAACGDWFIPDKNYIRNPGWTCRTYWTVANKTWSNSNRQTTDGWYLQRNDGTIIPHYRNRTYAVRAFRTVSY